jgi:hypothetical protein
MLISSRRYKLIPLAIINNSLSLLTIYMRLPCNVVSEKYRKPTAIGLMFLYIVFLIVVRRLNVL